MKLNTLFCLLMIVVGIIFPCVAFGLDLVSDTGFGEIIIKFLGAIALIGLATNAVSILAYKDRQLY
jgi:hypothetical protein